MQIATIKNLDSYFSGKIDLIELMAKTEDLNRLYEDCHECYWLSFDKEKATMQRKLELLLFRLENNLTGRDTKLR